MAYKLVHHAAERRKVKGDRVGASASARKWSVPTKETRKAYGKTARNATGEISLR